MNKWIHVRIQIGLCVTDPPPPPPSLRHPCVGHWCSQKPLCGELTLPSLDSLDNKKNNRSTVAPRSVNNLWRHHSAWRRLSEGTIKSIIFCDTKYGFIGSFYENFIFYPSLFLVRWSSSIILDRTSRKVNGGRSAYKEQRRIDSKFFINILCRKWWCF